MAFAWPARVYWEDTDAGGIVYYANYLRFLERARTEWLRSLGLSQRALAADPGIAFAVVGLEVQYRRPARLDDELSVTCEPQLDRAASLRFEQRILLGGERDRGGQLLLEARVRVACVDARTLRPRRLPPILLNAADRARCAPAGSQAGAVEQAADVAASAGGRLARYCENCARQFSPNQRGDP